MSVTSLPPPQPLVDPDGDLDHPGRADRWRPTRAGLVALWRFWDETFSFHNGRLLLRGPNGSGKSMALELLLPFLLDANASPHRLTSSAKSRGGLYERIMTGTDTTNRAGFAWIEFRRGDDVFTVGVRLRASASTRKVESDFFTTTLAVDDALHLLDEQRVPISRQALVEAIGSTGRVHNSGEDHRVAVAETLFPGFGPDRYSSVISALLALRKEKLSQDLDVAKLSAILSEALPPLDEHDLATVAEGFERLDRRREELARLDADVREVDRLRGRQRSYARAVIAARSDDVRRAESTRDEVTRREREASAELADTNAKISKLVAEQTDLGERIRTIDVTLRTLRDSDVVRQGKDLDAERQLVATLGTAVQRTQAAHRRTRDDADRAHTEFDDAAARADNARANLDTADRDLRPLADRVGAQQVVDDARTLVAPAGSHRESDPRGDDVTAAASRSGAADAAQPNASEPVSASAFTSLVGAWIDDKRAAITDVRTALDHHNDAVHDRDAISARVANDESGVESAITSERMADASVEAREEEFGRAISAWVESTTTLGVEAARAAVAMPVADDDEIERFRGAVVRLRTSWSSQLGSQRERLERNVAELNHEENILVAERDELATGRVISPPVPSWRSERRPYENGAPLWWLVDAAPTTAARTLDGVESALAASGLLDAWVHADGSVEIEPERFDLVLAERAIDGPSLADVFVAAAPADADGIASSGDSEVAFGRVDSDVVNAVLRSISLADSIERADPAGAVVIGRDGTFRIGAAVGRAPIQPARYLGAGARERRRLERLAELADALGDVRRRRTEIDREHADLERRDAAVRAELDAAPTGRELLEARVELANERVRLDDAQVRLDRSRRELSTADDAVRAALRALTNVGARLGLPTSRTDLDILSGALDGFARSVDTWGRRHDDLNREHLHLDSARNRAVRATVALAEDAAAVESARIELADAEQRLATLMSTIGQDYQEALARIDVLEREYRDGEQLTKELAARRPPLDKRQGALEETLAAAESERAEAELRRAEVHERFVRLIDDGLALDADIGAVEPDGPLDGVTEVLAAARAVADELADLDRTPATIDRLGNRVVERLHESQALLAGRVDFVRELSDDGWWTLRGVSGGVRRRIAELVATLAQDLVETTGELDADEEELFEQVLAGDIRRSLAERIRGANRLLDDINVQLGKVVTEAGRVAVRLRWDVDANQPASVSKARRLLLQDPAGLDDEQTAALRDFVRSRIEEARARLEANAPWDARLRETLDYRAWHRFGLEISHRDWEGYKTATASVLQRLSTGERSIALHLPMLASIAAHYAVAGSSAAGESSTCPRLVLLDELFAGVDPTNRAQLFATFTRWDLDAVFTSDHEWCQYADLDGIAIHQLHPTVGDEPVTSTRFTWDGRRRVIDPDG